MQRGHQVGMVGKVRVGRCRFACIHRPTDLVALVNQNEIPAKIDQTNSIPNRYKGGYMMLTIMQMLRESRNSLVLVLVLVLWCRKRESRDS